MRTATRVAGIVAGLSLSLGSLGVVAPSYADEPGDTPPVACAEQQAQVDRAAAALVRLTAVFERQQAKVRKARDRAETADTAQERNAARKALRTYKAQRDVAGKAKTAQQQRLARATGRLADCQAAQVS